MRRETTCILAAFVSLLGSASCLEDRDTEATEPAAAASAPLTGWFLSGPEQQSYRADLDLRTKRSGDASGRLTAIAPAPGGAGVLMQRVPADAYRGKRVRFSASVRTEGVVRWAGLWMKVDRPDARDPFDNMQDRPLGGTRDWERHAVVLDVPEDARAIELGLLQDGAGTSWIDEASFEVVGDDVAVTEVSQRPIEARDLGFEDARPEATWRMVGAARDDFRFERTTESPHGGGASGTIVNVVEAPRGRAALEQTFHAAAWRGKRVRFSAWLRGDRLEGSAGLWITTFGADAPPLSPGLTTAGNGRDGSFDWERLSVVVDVPPEADTIALALWIEARGKLWLDDATLEAVGTEVPLSSVDKRSNVLENAALEAGKIAPEGWFLAGGARSHYRAVIDREERHGGASSARFEPAVDAPQGYGTLMQQIKAETWRGKRVRMTAFVKGRDVDARGDLWLRVQARESPGDGPGLGGGACRLSGTFDWKPCTIVFDVPARGDAIDVGVGTTGHGTLWLDDVHLEEVGADVPLTHGRDTPKRVINGAFDAPTVAAGVPEGWFLSGGGGDDFTSRVDDGAALLLAKPGITPRGYGTLMQSVQAVDYLGKRLRVRARVRGEGVGSGDVWVRVQSPTSPGDGPGLGGGACALAGTFGWKPCEVVLDVPEGAASVQIGVGIRGDGAGKVWLDDVAIEEVDRGVDVTGRVSASTTPDNLGFELR